MRRSLIITILLVLVFVVGYLVISNNLANEKYTQSNEKLVISLTDISAYALIHIAENKGYFKEEGLEITYKKVPKGLDALTDTLNKVADIGLSFETPVVRKIFEGDKLSVISTLHTSTKNTALIGRKDKGIFIPENLKGKRIGVTLTTSYEFFLYSYLISQGIKLSDVTIVDTPLTQMATILKEGKVDAIAAGNPFLYDVKREFQTDDLSVFQSEVYTENSLISMREDVAIAKEESVKKFLKALVKAEKFYLENYEESLSAVVAELPMLSEESIRASFDEFTPTLKLDNVLLTILNREAQWFKDNGVYDGEVPNFRDVIFTDYLKSVKPEAVTIF